MGYCYYGVVPTNDFCVTLDMKYKIVDNFFNHDNYLKIKKSLLNEQEFYYVASISGGESDPKKFYGLGCNFVTESNKGKYQDRRNQQIVQQVNMRIMQNYGQEFGFRNVIRSRLDLTTYRGEHVKFKPHTDIDGKHWTSIFYLTTCNSPTILYEEEQPDVKDYYTNNIKDEELTEHVRVDAVDNRLLIFEGNHLHTGLCAYDVPVRLLLNSNFR